MTKNTVEVPFNFTPRWYQLELYQALDGIKDQPQTRKKRAFCRWHRRGGKDLAMVCYAFKEMVQVVGSYYYFFPTYQQGRKALWENSTKPVKDKAGNILEQGRKFLSYMPAELIERTNNQEMIMELKNGSIFRVIGTDNIDTIVGTNPIMCIFSEYALQDPRAWVFIQPILAENDGIALFNSTPRGRNHMYELDLKIRNNPDWFYSDLQTLWPDKPHYTGVVGEKQIQSVRDSGMSEDYIEQEFGVSYSAGLQGSILGDQIDRAKKEGRIGNFPYNSSYPVYTFWDLGFNDPTSIWFVQYIGNAIIFIDYWEQERRDIPDIIKEIGEKVYGYALHYLPHDAKHNYGLMTTKAKMMSEALRAHKVSGMVKALTIKPSITDGIDALRGRFKQYFFNESLTAEGMDKLYRYHYRYDHKTKVFAKEPVHDWCSHAADAARLEAIAAVFDQDLVLNSIRSIKTITSADNDLDY